MCVCMHWVGSCVPSVSRNAALLIHWPIWPEFFWSYWLYCTLVGGGSIPQDDILGLVSCFQCVLWLYRVVWVCMGMFV